ncbi:MAG: radical SAM protein [Desulfobacterales bacterium]|nr:MAG: radical SAM protein [Desulfobacterales bacterium]
MTLTKTVAFSKNSANLFFHILTKCNLKCRHCYINPAQHGQNTLPLATIKSWLEAFAPDSGSKNLVFLGGEPTLHPELPVAVKYARRLGFNSITIDTNGYLFHDILSKVTPEDVDYFSFSLDGATPETNDRIRGDGAYAACLDGIRRAIEKGFTTSLIYTVSSANIHELAMMPDLLENLGVDRFFIQVIGLRGKSALAQIAPDFGKSPQVSRSQWLDTVPAVARIIAERGITVAYPKVFLGLEENFECAGIVANNYFVFPNGRVYRCPLCEDFPIHSLCFHENQLVATAKLNEQDFFHLDIPEGCVMNKMIQPHNLRYREDGTPEYKIACCLLKEEISRG